MYLSNVFGPMAASTIPVPRTARSPVLDRRAVNPAAVATYPFLEPWKFTFDLSSESQYEPLSTCLRESVT